MRIQDGGCAAVDSAMSVSRIRAPFGPAELWADGALPAWTDPAPVNIPDAGQDAICGASLRRSAQPDTLLTAVTATSARSSRLACVILRFTAVTSGAGLACSFGSPESVKSAAC